MPRASSRPPRMFGSGYWPVLLFVSMALPRVRIDLPSKRKGPGDRPAEGIEGKGSKLVDWREREITLFHDRRLLPRIRIVFPAAKARDDEEVDIDILNDERLYRKKMAGEHADDPTTSLDEAIKKALAEDLDESDSELVFTPSAIKGSSEDREVVPVGSKVLIEGRRGSDTRGVALNFCYGLLRNGFSVTYISTDQTVKQAIEEMHAEGYLITQYLTDQKLLCIPVYPLLEGGEKDGLLDKLMASPQLRKTDALMVNTLSDFLETKNMEGVSDHVLWYLQGLEDMGKTAILVVDDDHTGIELLREASDLHILLPANEESTVKITRRHEPRSNLPALLFRIDAGIGARSRPRVVEPELPFQ